jgi:flagellum-specific peptidoglycan hydrolase FlgJ
MGWKDDPVAEQPAPKQVASPEQFVATYGPIAEKIGAEIGVDPKILLAQFGHETGWGRAIIPGTYNLGNIKDPSGKGVRAKDKVEGTPTLFIDGVAHSNMSYEDLKVILDEKLAG